MKQWLQKQWRTHSFWQYILTPLSWVFYSLMAVRRFSYRYGFLATVDLPVPVIVVGNINVGGTGKTPVVIWLVEQLRLQGLNPGVVSRGYMAAQVSRDQVQEVSADSAPELVGDEPVLMAQRLKCPIFVSQKRVMAVRALLAKHPLCDVVISDDGLQHYALARQFEIVVVDAQQGFGNGCVLPAGPLREPISRLNHVNAIIVNGLDAPTLDLYVKKHLMPNFRHNDQVSIKHKTHSMQLSANQFYQLINPQRRVEANHFDGMRMMAIAGIGNPERFFNQLKMMSLAFTSQAYADHHPFTHNDIAQLNANIILMTEKDAVKCRKFEDPRCWVLPVDATISPRFLSDVCNTIQ